MAEQPRPKREGEPGTWSYCGKSKAHAPHTHTVIMNEGPYYGVQCLGAGALAAPVLEDWELD